MTAPTPTTGAPSTPPTPAPTPPSPPAPATPPAPGSEQPQELPMAAEHVSYSKVFAAGDDGAPGTADVLNHVIESARSLDVSPDGLHGVVADVVAAAPRSWDALCDLVFESAGRHAIPFEKVEAALDGLRAHLEARDAYAAMRDDKYLREALQGLHGAHARRLADARINDAARALGRG